MAKAFDFITSINQGKDIMKDSIDEHEYSPYLTNMAFSLHIDTIFDANDMNCKPWLSNKMQYKYYMNIIQPKKRWAEWPKKDKVNAENVRVIKEIYKYNTKKAVETLRVLTDEQIKWLIKQQEEKGEINND